MVRAKEVRRRGRETMPSAPTSTAHTQAVGMVSGVCAGTFSPFGVPAANIVGKGNKPEALQQAHLPSSFSLCDNSAVARFSLFGLFFFSFSAVVGGSVAHFTFCLLCSVLEGFAAKPHVYVHVWFDRLCVCPLPCLLVDLQLLMRCSLRVL